VVTAKESTTAIVSGANPANVARRKQQAAKLKRRLDAQKEERRRERAEIHKQIYGEPLPEFEEIITAGVRWLSKRHHPDAGGSEDKMAAINAAADALRRRVSLPC
jgi:hypothetical protein